MNTLSSNTNESNKFVYQFADKLNLKNANKNMALGSLSIPYTRKNIKSKCNNNKFKISAPAWNDLPDGSYSVSDIQDYFESSSKKIIKKHGTIADNLPVLIYVNKIKNRIVFKTKTGNKLELLTEETMKLLGSSIKKSTDQNKDREIAPRLNNSYKQAFNLLLYQTSYLVN